MLAKKIWWVQYVLHLLVAAISYLFIYVYYIYLYNNNTDVFFTPPDIWGWYMYGLIERLGQGNKGSKAILK